MEISFETSGLLFSPMVILEAILEFSALCRIEIQRWEYRDDHISVVFENGGVEGVRQFFENLRFIALTSQNRLAFRQRVHEIMWSQFDIDPHFYSLPFFPL